MYEYECATVPIEKEEVLSPPTTRCHEDFETQIPNSGFRSVCMSIAAASILTITPYSATLCKSDFIETIGPDSSSVIKNATEINDARNISLSEARKMARKLQDRIDADYQRLLEADARARSIWEEEE